MFEVPYTGYTLSMGKMQPIYRLAARSRGIPGIPSSIHSFHQVFIDRLFRFAGTWNWLSHLYPATSRTTITGPAE